MAPLSQVLTTAKLRKLCTYICLYSLLIFAALCGTPDMRLWLWPISCKAVARPTPCCFDPVTGDAMVTAVCCSYNCTCASACTYICNVHMHPSSAASATHPPTNRLRVMQGLYTNTTSSSITVTTMSMSKHVPVLGAHGTHPAQQPRCSGGSLPPQHPGSFARQLTHSTVAKRVPTKGPRKGNGLMQVTVAAATVQS